MKKIFTTFLLLPIFCLSQNKKPNILFIAIDDLKPELGCYGNKLIKTPNIDRLAKMGTVFNANYCQQAVCGPTRASLMTGRRPDVTKIWDLRTQMREMNPDILTIPQYLISQGYTTSGIGKIYHPGCIDKKQDEPSWSIPYLKATVNDYPPALGEPASKHYQLAATKEYFKKLKPAGPKPALDEDAETSTIMGAADISTKGPAVENIDVPDNAYEDGANTLLAKKQLIALIKAGKPYFMAVGLHKPHLPFVAPKKYWDMYNRKDMPIAEFQEQAKNSPVIAYHNSSELRNYSDIPAFATIPSSAANRIGLKEEKQRELIHGYYAAVSYIDAQVGILLNTLESLGELENTIIILWGDHGWHLGDHDLWTKHTNYEQAARAPLIIASPGLKPGKSNSMTEHLDIFPTICDLAKLPIPTQLEGKSLQPVMRDKKVSVKEYSVSQYPRKLKKEEFTTLGYPNNKLMGYSMRTERYRYTIWMSDFTSKDPFSAKKIYATEMYDYQKDPLEKVNVVKDPGYTASSTILYQKMVDYFKSQSRIK